MPHASAAAASPGAPPAPTASAGSAHASVIHGAVKTEPQPAQQGGAFRHLGGSDRAGDLAAAAVGAAPTGAHGALPPPGAEPSAESDRFRGQQGTRDVVGPSSRTAAREVAGEESPSPPRSPVRRPLQQSWLPGASQGAGLTFSTHIVGRKFQQPGGACADGDALTLKHEADNPRDRWAMLVCGGSGAALGHVPADVAKWLAPLLSKALVSMSGTVIEEPLSPAAPVLISVQVHIT